MGYLKIDLGNLSLIMNKSLTFIKTNPKKPSSKVNHLIAIGIDKYRNCPELYNCVGDAEKFIETLLENYQFEERNIRRIYNEEATRANIISTIRHYAASLTETDYLIIYYSGHGEYDSILDEGYWIPVDATRDDEFTYFNINALKAGMQSYS